MKQPYTAFAHTAAGSFRCISGMTAYDEKLIGGRLVARYLNPCGQILPEMHLPDAAFDTEDGNVFALTVDGELLQDGWSLENVEMGADTSRVTLRHGACPVQVQVLTHADGKDWISRELIVKNLGEIFLPVDSVAPLCG